jgi:hypothetical protein
MLWLVGLHGVLVRLWGLKGDPAEQVGGGKCRSDVLGVNSSPCSDPYTVKVACMCEQGLPRGRHRAAQGPLGSWGPCPAIKPAMHVSCMAPFARPPGSQEQAAGVGRASSNLRMVCARSCVLLVLLVRSSWRRR